jgi:hypothetical protein
MPSYRPEISVLTRFTCALSSLRWWSLVSPLALVAALLPGCSKEIGDGCSTALDCSASGTRLCDMTQRGGYCTLDSCEANTCPDEAVCVAFGRRFEGQPVDRLARTFCMLKCDDDSDCRTDDNYACFAAAKSSASDKTRAFGAGDEAQILGDSKQKFCAQKPSTFVLPDAGMSEPEDAAISTPAEDAGMSTQPEEDDAGTAPSD